MYFAIIKKINDAVYPQTTELDTLNGWNVMVCELNLDKTVFYKRKRRKVSISKVFEGQCSTHEAGGPDHLCHRH